MERLVEPPKISKVGLTRALRTDKLQAGIVTHEDLIDWMRQLGTDKEGKDLGSFDHLCRKHLRRSLQNQGRSRFLFIN